MPPITLTAPELRAAHESPRARYTRTATGIVIGGAWLRRATPAEAQAISGPARAPDTLGDKAVRWACGAGALAVAVLLVVERLA